MTWLFYAFLAIIFSVIYYLLSRILSVKSKNPRAFSVVFNLTGAFVSSLLILVEPFSLHDISIRIILFTFLSTVFMALFERNQFYARKYIPASSVSIIFKLSPAVTVLVSILIWGESFTIKKLLAILLIFTANVLVVYKGLKLSELKKGLKYALLASSSLGIAWALDKQASIGYSLSLYSTLLWLAPAIYNVFLPPIPLKTLIREVKIASWKIILLALANVLNYYFILKTFSLTEASKAIPVTTSSTVFVVLFAALFLKEKDNLFKKLFAAILIIFGVIIMKNS